MFRHTYIGICHLLILSYFYLFCFQVAYEPTPEGVGGLLTGLPGGSSAGVGGWRGVFKSMVRNVVSDVKEEVMAELSSTMNGMDSVEKRYMAKDDTADRIK